MGLIQERLSRRDPVYWRDYALRLLFCLALGLALMAVMTFVAHNWTYLATVTKLGLVFALIVVAVGLWIWQGPDSRTGSSAGLVAQVGIGVWLASAGQLYQAPGGVQTLMINWAFLGLPFALASRNDAHWALWFGLIFVASVTAPADFMDWASPDLAWNHQFLIGGVILGAAFVLSIWRRQSAWLSAWVALGSGLLLFFTLMSYLFDDGIAHPAAMLALGIAIALAAYAYRETRAIAGLTLMSVSIMSQIVAVLLYYGLKLFPGGIIEAGYAVIIVGGATALLYQIFTHYLRHFGRIETEVADADQPRPWYMDMFIAIGGVVTAIFGAAFLSLFLALFLALTQQVEIGLIVIGSLIFASSLIFYRRTTGLFIRHGLGTLLIIGGATVIGGFGALSGNLMVASIVAFILASVTLWLIQDHVIQVVMGLTIGTSVLTILFDIDVHHVIPVDTTLLPTLGLIALFWLFKARKTRLTAFAVMWSVLIAGSLFGSLKGLWGLEWAEPGIIPLWVISLLARFILGSAIFLGLKRLYLETLPDYRLLIALVLAGAMLPPGGVAVIIFLLVGIALGSRTLALLGAIMVGAWVLWSYFDLGFTLMQLSGAFAFGSAVSAGLYWGLQKEGRVT